MKRINYWGLSLFSGLLLGFSWHSIGFPLLLFVAFVPLLFVESRISFSTARRKGASILGYAFITFVIFNAIAVRWLWGLEESREFGYLGPVFANAFFMAVVFWSFYIVKKNIGNFWGYIYLPVVWISFEKLHMEWSLSFPWLNLGNGFAGYYQWVQWYEYTGVFGGTLWVWIVNLLIFFAIKTYISDKKLESILKKMIVVVLLIVVPIAASLWRYHQYESHGEEVKVSVLQPNLNPYTQKFSISNDQMSSQLVEMTHKYVPKDVDYVVTPETSLINRGAVDLDHYQEDLHYQKIQQLASEYPHTQFVIGSIMSKLYATNDTIPSDANESEGQNYSVYNAAFQVGVNEPFSVYKKSKLVVGVESSPFKSLSKLSLVKGLMLNLGGTSTTLGTQPERYVFLNHQNKFKPGVAICYESIYGEFVTEYVKKGANLLFVITNDGWWGNTDGHVQHLNLSRLRAIENRRYIARSANTGISCFITPKGDIINQLEYEKEGVLTEIIQTNEKLTPYTRYGDVIMRIALLLLGGIWAWLIASAVLKKVKKKGKFN